MNEAIQNDLNERKKRFQSIMVGAPREFITWAGNWFATQALVYGIQYDSKMDVATTTPVPEPVVKPLPLQNISVSVSVDAPEPKKVVVGKAKPVKWVTWSQAPIVKKKAAHPVSLHMKKGTRIKWKVSGSTDTNLITCTGVADGFTKLGVKVIADLVGKSVKVPYYKVLEIQVPA